MAAAGPLRPSPGRFSGNLGHAPFDPEGSLGPHSRDFIKLSRRALALAEQQPTPERLADAGLIKLIEGELDTGTDLLLRAKEMGEPSAQVYTDLSVLYLARGHAESSPELYFRAVAAARKAVELDDSLLEARFNLALALELLGISWEARRAWRSYLAADGDSEWADEARRHFRSLIRVPEETLWKEQKERLQRAALRDDQEALARIVKRFPLRARLYGEEDLLGEWAERQSNGDLVGAARALDMARALGLALARTSGDHMLTDVVAVIDNTAASLGHPAGLDEAHLAYREGLRAYGGGDLSQAVALLASARHKLYRLGSPLAHWAGVQLATSLYHQGRYQEAQDLLTTIRDEDPSLRYPNLYGRSLWILGLIEFVRSRFEVAYQKYAQSVDVYRESGESESAASVHALMAEYSHFIGEQSEAWKHLAQALQVLGRVPIGKTQMILSCGAVVSRAGGEPVIAYYFRKEEVRIAFEVGNSERIVSALNGRAHVTADMGRADLALRDIEHAKTILAGVRDHRPQEELEGDLLLLEADLQRERKPRRALDAAMGAIEIYRNTEYRARLPEALLARARVHLMFSQLRSAEADFAEALEELSIQRSALLSTEAQVSFFDQAQRFYEEVAEFYADSLGRPDLAYFYVEQAQARVLLDGLVRRSGEVVVAESMPVLSEVSQQVPQGVVLVQFSVHPLSTLIWTIWRGGVTFAKVEIGERQLSGTIENFRAAILRDDRESIRRIGEYLYVSLVGSLSKAPRYAKVVFIPDQSLHDLPFAALVNPDTGTLVSG